MEHGTSGDPGVEPTYARRWLGTDPASSGGRTPYDDDIVHALERLAAEIAPSTAATAASTATVPSAAPAPMHTAPGDETHTVSPTEDHFDLETLRARLRDWLESFPTVEERLVAASRHLSRKVPRGGRYDMNPERYWFLESDMLEAVLAPDLDRDAALRWFGSWGATVKDPVPLNQDRLVRWFMERARAVGAPPQFQYTPKWERRRIWNPGTETVSGPPVPAWMVGGTYILAEPARRTTETSVGQLNIVGLIEMGRLLDVPEPPNGLVHAIREAHARNP